MAEGVPLLTISSLFGIDDAAARKLVDEGCIVGLGRGTYALGPSIKNYVQKIKDEKTGRIVSLDAITETLDLSRMQIGRLVDKGIIPKAARGQYEVVPCVVGYIKYLRSSIKERPQAEEASARARLIAAKAETAEIDLAIKREEYAPVSEMLEVMTSAYSLVKERLLSIPSKLAIMLVDRDMLEIEHRLREEVFEALDELRDPKFGSSGEALESGSDSEAGIQASSEAEPD